MKETIPQPYKPTEVKKIGSELIQSLEKYYQECYEAKGRSVPALNPLQLIELAQSSMSKPTRPFAELAELALSFSHRLHDPRYMGHQVPPVIPASALFDVLGRAANQGAAVFEMAPFGTGAERAVVQELGKLVGWTPGAFAGIGTHGGTLANVTALLAARNIRYPKAWREGMTSLSDLKPAIMTSEDSHYCIARACGILGMGTSQLIKVPMDVRRKMDLVEARKLLLNSKEQGLDVFAIVGSACTTPTGSFDDLEGVAALAREFKLWFHVDGAHGASFLFSQRYKALLKGVELADSLAWDAHKMLFVPALSTYLLYKNAKHSWEAFAQDAPYLFDPKDPQGLAEFDGGLRTFECTKGALSIGLWGVWSLYGKEFLASLIDRVMDNTKILYELLKSSDDFEPAHEPECNILCFQYKPAGIRTDVEKLSELQFKIRNQLLKEGEGYITGTRLGGRYYLRVTVINPLTLKEHFISLMDKIRGVAKNLES
jgi:L-2,4-diaminobutyrate decarboxylase